MSLFGVWVHGTRALFNLVTAAKAAGAAVVFRDSGVKFIGGEVRTNKKAPKPKAAG